MKCLVCCLDHKYIQKLHYEIFNKVLIPKINYLYRILINLNKYNV